MMGIAEPAETSPAVLKTGTLFERRYKVLGPLGEGARKRTYLAEDTHLGRKVALAVVKDAASARTIPEWQALAQIAGHYNIVTMFDRGTADGVEYLVFEYLSGGTLSDYLAKRKDPLTVDEALRLGRQLARALSHMHGKGMIHRDVAAANIWLDERHSPHLGDFDLAVLREAQSDSDSRSVSTEGYAAPERAAGGPVDERSDLYSLGAVLYEAVTGRRAPCEGPQRNAEIAGCLAARRPVLPHRLTDVICRLLAESPQDRPDSAQEVLDALKVTRDPLDSEDAWTGTLPFPLASVLWLYLAEPEPATKVEFLLRFFESLAQFSATVLLSAGMSDPVFSTANRSEWFGDPDGPRPLDLRIPTFGTWVELTKRLASTGRQMLEGHGDETDHYLKLFTATDADLIEALVSKKLDEILRHACVRRNEWIGHGGRTNPKVLRDRLGDLEEVLARTRSLFAWSFMPWTLVKPGASMSRHGVHVLTATILTGANAAFRKRQIELSHPCDAELLYFQNRENPEALAVAPLIRMISDDDTGEEACYFYNRAEGDQVRWVSYHYLGVPERRLPDEDVLTFISTLAP